MLQDSLMGVHLKQLIGDLLIDRLVALVRVKCDYFRSHLVIAIPI